MRQKVDIPSNGLTIPDIPYLTTIKVRVTALTLTAFLNDVVPVVVHTQQSVVLS